MEHECNCVVRGNWEEDFGLIPGTGHLYPHAIMIVGVGIDIVEVMRVERLLERRSVRSLARLFTPAEQTYCTGRPRPALHLAARLAAKEAASKALGTGFSGGVSWREIEVVADADGRPMLAFLGMTAKVVTRRCGEGHRWHLSLSHDRHYATAVALVETPDTANQTLHGTSGAVGIL